MRRRWLQPTSAWRWAQPAPTWRLETAGIALMSDDLSKIPEAIRLSRLTLRNIRQNLVDRGSHRDRAARSASCSAEVHMAGGMLVHQVSVLVVIANGMRLLRA